MPYEVVVHLRALKDQPHPSPITFASQEEAEAAAEPIRNTRRDGELIDLPWLQVDAKDVLSIHVRETREIRPMPSLSGLLSADENLDRIKELAPGTVVDDGDNL